ncbi:related to Glutamate decarboxylase 1 [Ustilago bromivora]|uniref:Related to Glutamate decarboxylase 1 n=1 Tax=Ustilago bromivora TaxID=307758 RepID=A0A1K0G7C4_9BASI|nr:related to Glutamate decarboxylase 1 [Ustilago bromivora]
MPSEDFSRFSSKELETLLGQIYEPLTQWAKAGERHGASAHPNPQAAPIKLLLEEEGCSRQEILQEVEEALRRSVNPWTGRFWEKLYSRPDPVGIAGDIVVACSNASGHVESANPYFARVETFCVRELAKVFGMDPDLSDGVTMPGGSASNTLALQTCLISRFPSFRIEGVAGLYSDLQRHDSIASCAPSERSTGHERRSVKKVLVFASEHCHYSIEQSAVACGLGSSSVIKVAGDEGGKMSVDCLAQAVQSSLEGGDAPLFVCATAGMTVLGTFDDIRAISSVCEEGLTSQLKVEALYLFHSVSKANLAAGFDHATKTLGCGRRPDAFKFYLAWKRHGSKGFGERITQALVQAEDLRGYILLHRDSLALELGPVPSPPFLQVCFRPLAPVKSPAALANGLSEQQLLDACVLQVHCSFQHTRFAVDFAPLPQLGRLYIRYQAQQDIWRLDTVLVNRVSSTACSGFHTMGSLSTRMPIGKISLNLLPMLGTKESAFGKLESAEDYDPVWR